jgi:hypothetical protein
MLKKDWITGLNAPKGISIQQGRLFVAEKDSITVVNFQPPRGKDGFPVIMNSSRVAIGLAEGGGFRNAQMLNDVVATPWGDVYVTDTFGDRIYQVTVPSGWVAQTTLPGVPPPGVRVTEFVSGLHLMSPNGIALQGTKLWVAGSDTFTGLGNFVSQRTPLIRTEEPTDFEKPLPMPGSTADAPAYYDALNLPLVANPREPRDSGEPPREYNIANSFAKAHHGKIYSIDTASHKVEILPDPDGAFGSLVLDGLGSILVQKYATGEIVKMEMVLRVTEPILTIPASEKARNSNPGHFSLDQTRRILYIPSPSTGEILIYGLD